MADLKLPRVEPTPEGVYYNRRTFLKQMGFVGAAAWLGAYPPGCDAQTPVDDPRLLRPGIKRAEVLRLFPAPRNARYLLDGDLTDPRLAAAYNNFYEFTTDKDRVWLLAQQFEPDPPGRPWTVEVTGLCHKPRTFDMDQVVALAPLEERTYRFRCVEAWAMDVPWTGYELNRLLLAVEPMSDAKYVRFWTAHRPAQMPGIESQPWYPWPYFEGLRMDEAMHALTLVATGIYGRPLPRQHGAPLRIVVPWKYGYKSPKSIVKIELVAEQPPTFWEKVAPEEYPFLSNVNPAVPHPRWSQASERLLGGGRRATLAYNGYGAYVARLYA